MEGVGILGKGGMSRGVGISRGRVGMSRGVISQKGRTYVEGGILKGGVSVSQGGEVGMGMSGGWVAIYLDIRLGHEYPPLLGQGALDTHPQWC